MGLCYKTCILTRILFDSFQEGRGGYDLDWIVFASKLQPNQFQYNSLVWFSFDKNFKANRSKPNQFNQVWSGQFRPKPNFFYLCIFSTLLVKLQQKRHTTC